MCMESPKSERRNKKTDNNRRTFIVNSIVFVFIMALLLASFCNNEDTRPILLRRNVVLLLNHRRGMIAHTLKMQNWLFCCYGRGWYVRNGLASDGFAKVGGVGAAVRRSATNFLRNFSENTSAWVQNMQRPSEVCQRRISGHFIESSDNNGLMI